MAGRKDFADLKKFGTKELKFKQGVHIDAAHKNQTFGQTILSAPVYEQAKEGICVALTLEWLKSQLTEGTYGLFNATPMSAVENFQHQLTVAHAAQFHIAYQEERKTKNRRDSLTLIAAEYGLKIANDEENELTGPTEPVLTEADMTCEAGQGVYFSVGIQKGAAKYRHAIGLTKKKDGIRFFDSNVGAYLVTDHLNFYERWMALLRDKLGWTVGNCHGFRVSNVIGVTPPTVRS
ncbi:MAG: hypothetical protein KGJ73_10360 [Rhodospirillales bacterium]|nr:hypothetical protein [Rhodospirillales bacterium]